MGDDRTTLAVPIDVARQFDSTVTQAQIDADTFQNSGDDLDLLASMITDAEDEFRALTNESMRVTRVGVPGTRENFETVQYALSGHKQYRQDYSHYTFDYGASEEILRLDNDRILPFDSNEGDAVYIYRGLSDGADAGWEDITDERGETWEIINHVNGELVLSPREIRKAYRRQSNDGIGLGTTRQNSVRLQVSYRHGTLGGERGRASQTTLDASLTDSQTGTVAVADGGGFPTGQNGGTIVVLIGREYLEVRPDPANDQMDIVTRGVRGTTAAAHSSGDRVQYTPPAIRKAIAARAGVQLVQSGRYSEWLPDTDDDLSKSDIQGTMQETWERTVEVMG